MNFELKVLKGPFDKVVFEQGFAGLGRRDGGQDILIRGKSIDKSQVSDSPLCLPEADF